MAGSALSLPKWRSEIVLKGGTGAAFGLAIAIVAGWNDRRRPGLVGGKTKRRWSTQ
jgi:hypothetical protein